MAVWEQTEALFFSCGILCRMLREQPAHGSLVYASLPGHLQAQILSVQVLTIPSLLGALGQGGAPSSDKAPLLVSGQNTLCQVFTTWLDSSGHHAHGEAGLTAGHSPALLAFAAAVTLLKDLPGFSGVPFCYCVATCLPYISPEV